MRHLPALLFLAFGACATVPLRPAAPVDLGSTRADVWRTHGPPQFEGEARRDGHSVAHLVYENAFDLLVVCLVDDGVVAWSREPTRPVAPCAAYPDHETVASR